MAARVSSARRAASAARSWAEFIIPFSVKFVRARPKGLGRSFGRMQQIVGRDAALTVLTDPAYVVPPVPPASAGVAWLRATVARFSSGAVHERRRALVIALLDAIPLESLRAHGEMHPVAILGRAVGSDESVIDLV